jgi:flavoprotein
MTDTTTPTSATGSNHIPLIAVVVGNTAQPDLPRHRLLGPTGCAGGKPAPLRAHRPGRRLEVVITDDDVDDNWQLRDLEGLTRLITPK